MKFRLLAATAALAVASLCATAASAATLIVDDNGKLTGATGVDVGGTFYDVAFIDGISCAAAFNGCDSDADLLPFHTSPSVALLAAQALLDQVFVGLYDNDPTRTLGCTDAVGCATLIPFNIVGPYFQYAYALNLAGDGDRTSLRTDLSLTANQELNDASVTFARFTPSTVAPVPEPSTWAMMLVGFGAIGASMRRRRRGTAIAQMA